MNAFRRNRPGGCIRKLFDGGVFPIVVTHSRQKVSERGTRHYHPTEVEIHIIHEGHGFYFIRDRRYALKEHSILIIHPRETHYFIPTVPLSLLDQSTVIFNPGLLRTRLPFISSQIVSLVKCSPHFRHQFMLDEKEFTRANILVKDMDRENAEKGMFWQGVVVGDLLAMLALCARSARLSRGLRPSRPTALVGKAMAYIEGHYAEKLRLRELSQAVTCSAFHLSHVFRQSTGSSFKQYLTTCRVRHAKRLLEESDLKIMGVATQVGFPDFQTFNRSFKQLVGFTPSTYRNFHRL